MEQYNTNFGVFHCSYQIFHGLPNPKMLSVSRKFKKHNNPISWNKTAEIAGISQIGDGFDLVMI